MVGDVQRDGVILGSKFKDKTSHGGRCPVLDGEEQRFILAAQVEIGIAPRMQLGAATQRLPGACVGGSLARMVDEEDCSREATLELAEVGKKRGDFSDHIFVDAMQAHEWIEDEELGSQGIDGFLQSVAVVAAIESEAGRRDDMDVEGLEGDTGGARDAGEPAADDVQGVLSSEEKHGPRLRHGKPPQACSTGGHRDRDIESEEGLAALGFTAHDADRLIGPQSFDEPAPRFGTVVELVRLGERQGAHARRLASAGFDFCGGAKTSR